MQARHALFLSTLFLSASALAAEAPMPPMPPEHPHHPSPAQMVQHMDEKAGLQLSDTQKQQMQAALADEHESMKAAHLKSKERMAQILTPEQQAKLTAQRDAMKARRADRMQRQADRLEARADSLKRDAAVTAPVVPQPAER